MCFREPELKSGTVGRDPVLGPKPISGNFASVFSVTSRSGHRYAVKCFTQDVAAQESRYDAISRHLAALDRAALSQPWNIGFEYQPQGVLVAGQWYPLLKMEWAEGNSLIRWIEDHRADPAALGALADRFAALTADLAATGVAHGDLQHGNLLVARDGTFRLVDYDGMFVPALAGYRATEMGHRNYQSPQRSDTDFGPGLDRFSAWVIYVSLAALSADPMLWDQLHESGGEFLLLTEDDFRAPAASFRFGTLLSHPDPRLRDLAGRMRDLSAQPLSELPTLPPGMFSGPAAPPRARPSVHSGSIPHPSAPSNSGSYPSWLTGHLPSTVPAPPTASVSVSASSGASASAGSGFQRRRRADVVLACCMTLLVLAPTLLTVSSLLAASAYPTAQGGAMLAAFGAGGASRRTRSEVRALRLLRRDLRRRSQTIGHPEKALASLDQEAQALDRHIQDREAKGSARIRQLQAEQNDEGARVTITLNQRLAAIDGELAALPRREQERRDRALAPLQRSHIQDQLRRTPIGETAKLSNLGAGTTSALIGAGIRTAADFTAVHYVTGGGYGNVTAMFVLANGRQVKVPSIGEKRARTLESWRKDIENRARRSAPVKLSPAELNSLAAQTAAERSRLHSERKRAQTDAQTHRDRLRTRITTEQRAVMDAQQAARADDARARAEMSQRRAQLALLRDDRAAVDAALTLARRTGRGLSLRRYLLFLVTGR
ncbi:hypothetical protein [Streptomyces sp. CA-111067]|uniref:hypothetical protein n=1 Tax=Streptomyces sp. CA-111067 TaxID=3240046 RepID=UPI003D97F328